MRDRSASAAALLPQIVDLWGVPSLFEPKAPKGVLRAPKGRSFHFFCLFSEKFRRSQVGGQFFWSKFWMTRGSTSELRFKHIKKLTFFADHPYTPTFSIFVRGDAPTFLARVGGEEGARGRTKVVKKLAEFGPPEYPENRQKGLKHVYRGFRPREIL